MSSIYANRNSKGDFIFNELERQITHGGEVYIASAFFTEADLVERMVAADCTVHLIVRLGFPTSPAALARVMRFNEVKVRFFTSHSFHPKLYIFDDRVALIGSANFTRAALTSNQEVMVAIGSEDDRFGELAELFADYWATANVLTSAELDKYKALYVENQRFEASSDALATKVLEVLGDTAPSNIGRAGPKASESTLFLQGYRKTYQEAVAAFEIARSVYREVGYRKAPEAAVPLRIEIDSFISYVRERVAQGEAWQAAPIKPAAEQRPFIRSMIEQWAQLEWPHFERTIVPINYPRLLRVFSSPEAIEAATDEALFDSLATLHSFHDRFRFFEGGLAGWRREFPTFNDPVRTRRSLAYLVHGEGDVVQRMANLIFQPEFKLKEFGRANVQELIGWMNREDLPIINSRTTKVLRFFGSKVRQL